MEDNLPLFSLEHGGDEVFLRTGEVVRILPVAPAIGRKEEEEAKTLAAAAEAAEPDALLHKREVVKATRAAAAPTPRRLESMEDNLPLFSLEHGGDEVFLRTGEVVRILPVAPAIGRKEEEEAKKLAAAAAEAAAKQEAEAKKAAEEQRKREEEECEKQQQAQEAAKKLQREFEDAMADGVITAEEQRQIDAQKAALDAAQKAQDQATAARKAAEEQRRKEEEEAKMLAAAAAAAAAKQEADAKKAAEEQRKREEEEREKLQAKKVVEEQRRRDDEERMKLQEEMQAEAKQEAEAKKAAEEQRKREEEEREKQQQAQEAAKKLQREVEDAMADGVITAEEQRQIDAKKAALDAAQKAQDQATAARKAAEQFRSDLESGIAEAKQKKEAAALAKRNSLAAAQAAEKEKLNNVLQLQAKEKELHRERAYDLSVLRARQIQEAEEFAKRQQAEEVARKEEAKRKKMLAMSEASEKAGESNIAETGILYKAENRGLVITGLKSGTNAADSDFKVGDVIIELDDDFVVGMNPYEFKMRMRGERGSMVDVVATRVENNSKKRVSDLVERDVVLPPMQAEPGVKLKVTSSSTTVTQVFEATSAEHEGILVGDQIIMIDDEFVTGIDAKEIPGLMRGLAGTDVDIVLLRMKEGKKQRHEIQVVRDHNLVAIPVKSRYGETGPAYICMHLCLTCTKAYTHTPMRGYGCLDTCTRACTRAPMRGGCLFEPSRWTVN
jgi:C-terminal processing protease CtpA/Prc